MYTKGTNKYLGNPRPFTVICNHCGSHDVTVVALEYYDLAIKCENCGAYLSYGRYNEKDYRED